MGLASLAQILTDACLGYNDLINYAKKCQNRLLIIQVVNK